MDPGKPGEPDEPETKIVPSGDGPDAPSAGGEKRLGGVAFETADRSGIVGTQREGVKHVGQGQRRRQGILEDAGDRGRIARLGRAFARKMHICEERHAQKRAHVIEPLVVGTDFHIRIPEAQQRARGAGAHFVAADRQHVGPGRRADEHAAVAAADGSGQHQIGRARRPRSQGLVARVGAVARVEPGQNHAFALARHLHQIAPSPFGLAASIPDDGIGLRRILTGNRQDALVFSQHG